jgi:hypothetical protein
MAARPRARTDEATVLERVFDTARVDNYEGYSKHDGLNARWLGELAAAAARRDPVGDA